MLADQVHSPRSSKHPDPFRRFEPAFIEFVQE
jgi:hypothetical protein